MKEKKTWLFLVITAAILVVLPLFITNSYMMQILIMMLLYAMMASGWNIIGGYGGQIALGNGLYAGIGASFAAGLFKSLHISPWIGIVIAGLIAGFVGLLMGYAIFNLSGSYYGLSTVALLNVMRILFNQNQTMFGLQMGGPTGLKVPWVGTAAAMQFIDKRYYYYLILAALILVLLVSNYIRHSRFGYYLLAISTNPTAAGSLGVNGMKVKELAQFLSSVVLGIAGGIYAFVIMYLDPGTMFGFSLAIDIMLMCVIGGKGTVFGPVIGAFLLVPLDEMLRFMVGAKLPGFSAAFFGLLLMISMQFMPKGIIVMFEEFKIRASVNAGSQRTKGRGANE